MAYASRVGRARVSAKKPEALAVCDRCGIWYNLVDLKFQYDWRGAVLQNLRLLVCDRCYDKPQEQLRAIVLPADPQPKMNARVEAFAQDESDYRAVSKRPRIDPTTGLPIPGAPLRITQDDQNRVTEPYGLPVGDTQDAVMPYGANNTQFRVRLQVLSVTSDGSATVTVTCSAVHGLQTNSQVSVEGLEWSPACGIYTAVPTTATAFTYMTYGANPIGSMLTSTTLILTALMGLP